MIFVFLSRMKRDETFRVNIVDHSNKSIDHPSCDHLQFATRIINNFIAEMYRTRVSYHESLDLFNAIACKKASPRSIINWNSVQENKLKPTNPFLEYVFCPS